MIAWQIAKKVKEMEAKTNERERKVHAICANAKEKVMRAREKERLFRFALILSWVFFANVMLFSCGSIEQFRVKRLSSP